MAFQIRELKTEPEERAVAPLDEKLAVGVAETCDDKGGRLERIELMAERTEE